MPPYWITFDNHKAACIEAPNEGTARTKAADITGAVVKSCDILPYPADPRIGDASDCPSFCYSPESCKGQSSCPKRYACSE